jgi:hypothetical protein
MGPRGRGDGKSCWCAGERAQWGSETLGLGVGAGCMQSVSRRAKLMVRKDMETAVKEDKRHDMYAESQIPQP